jgi:DNA mismatch repair protein MutL
LSKESQLVIRSIPIIIPYLDLRLFLESVVELELFHVEHLVKVISQSQRFDPKLLSYEERMELNLFLLHFKNKEAQQEHMYKALSVDDCRMLLHV